MRTCTLIVSIAFALLACCGIASGATRADVGGPFTLVDQDGARVTEKTFAGRPVLLYFGYTTCPDVCPLDLANIAAIAKRIRAAGIDVKPIFVTVDPERDTSEKLKAYMHFFGADFSGLTGTPAEIAKIGDEYHVYYKKVPTANGYMVDHSTVLFLLGADGAYLDHYGRSLSIEDVVTRALTRLKAPIAAAGDNRTPRHSGA